MPRTNNYITVALTIQEGKVDQLLAEVNASGGHTDGAAKHYDPPSELADMFGDQQFEPLMIIAVTLSFGFLMKRVAQIYRDLSHPKGLLVDARVIPIQVIESQSLDRGDVVILRKDRTDSFTRDEKDAALEALEGIFAAGSV